jgi:hypothetical protein
MTLTEDELTEPERCLCQASAAGRLLDLREGNPRVDDPRQAGDWGSSRSVRAELLIELVTGTRRPEGAPRSRAVKLVGACITGTLDLEATTLICPLLLQGCYFEEPINLREAQAPVVRLPTCQVPSLIADQLETRGNLELDRGFAARGGVSLWGAQIGGLLSLDGAQLSNSDGLALDLSGVTVGASLLCSDLTAQGEVCLASAHIGGALDLSGAHLTNPGGQALSADGVTVGQSAHCGEGFTAEGEVRLLGGRVGGFLDFRGAHLTKPDGQALVGHGLTVNLAMFCRDGFTVEGELALPGAQIGSMLDLAGARLTNPDGEALDGHGLTVQDLRCRDGFTATGEVRLPGARISRQLRLDGARLANPRGLALDLAAAQVTDLYLQPRDPPDGVVDLTNTRVGSFSDDPATWPAIVRLDGFVYDTLKNDQVGVRARLAWVRRHPGGYTPQVYEQLAAAYRRAGQEEAARVVLIAKQWHRRQTLNLPGKLWNWLLYLTVGYGYRTWLAGLWLIGLLALGTLVFDRAYPTHLTAASQPTPPFHPVA